jgi:ABC-type dipeptide/oligopeptide/nickel transport system permease component
MRRHGTVQPPFGTRTSPRPPLSVRGTRMGSHIVQRLLISFPALLGVLFLCFCLLQVVPADPAMIIAGPDARSETIAAIRLELGLDRPIAIQFANYIGRVAQGDLGRSIISNKMVIEELANTIGPTVELMLGAMLLAVPIGIGLGTLAAVKRGSVLDRTIMAISVAGVSMPVFFIGLILIQYVGYKWGLLPFTGRTGPVWAGGLPSLVLPACTLGSVLIGPIARITRAAVLEVLGADFVRTARAKGLRESVVIVRHALRNALIPVVTLIGLQAAFLLGGAVVTETIFSWPGVGRLAVGAIVSSDFPTAQGAIMILAVAFLLINLIVDVLYVYLDPRVQRA